MAKGKRIEPRAFEALSDVKRAFFGEKEAERLSSGDVDPGPFADRLARDLLRKVAAEVKSGKE